MQRRPRRPAAATASRAAAAAALQPHVAFPHSTRAASRFAARAVASSCNHWLALTGCTPDIKHELCKQVRAPAPRGAPQLYLAQACRRGRCPQKIRLGVDHKGLVCLVGRRWRRPRRSRRRIHSRRWRCCRRERRQRLKRSSSLHHLLGDEGCLFPSNALSTDNVGCRFLPPAGKDTNEVSGAEHACRIQPFRNLTSVTTYSPKPRPNRALK